MKKIIGLFFVLVILIGYEIPVFASAFESDNTEPKLIGVDAIEADSTEQELVSVELYSDDDKVIIGQVPESYESEYLAKLNSADFRNAEINNSLIENADTVTTTQQMNLTGQSMDTSYAIQSYSTSSTQVTYFNLQDAQRVLTAMDSSVDWPTLML